MKINLNKKLISTLIAGSIALSLTSCSALANENTTEEINNSDLSTLVINTEDLTNNYESTEQGVVYLLPISLPKDIKLELPDGTTKPLSEFEKTKEKGYQIPSNTFTVVFNKDGKDYSYKLEGENDSSITITGSYTPQKEPAFYVEKITNISEEELNKVLEESSINLDKIINNSGSDIEIVKVTNTNYNKDKIEFERTEICLKTIILYQEINNNNDYSYFSSLRRGDGHNTIEIINKDTVRITYDKTYKNDYRVLDNIENNVNYFFNKVNNTKDLNYYTKGYTNLTSVINQERSIKEHIEAYYKGQENRCIRYSYKIDNSPLLEFGQVNYTNEYYINDFNGNINEHPAIQNNKVL